MGIPCAGLTGALLLILMAEWWLASFEKSTTTLSTAPDGGARMSHAPAMSDASIEPCHEQLLRESTKTLVAS
jgi:hypothetical protein